MENIEKIKTKDKRKGKIPFSELAQKLKVKTARTLASTKGFPKPIIVEGDYLYPISKVCQFFKIDSLEEPFLTTEEAAEFLQEGTMSVTAKASRGTIPSYKLKHQRGSGYLFRKSELEKYASTTLTPNIDHINRAMARREIDSLFVAFLSAEMSGILTDREYDVLKRYLMDGNTMEEIGEEFQITRERVRQIFRKSLSRTKRHVERIVNNNYSNMLLENRLLKRQVKMMSNLDKNPVYPEDKKQYDMRLILYMASPIAETFNEMSARFYTCMNIADFKFNYEIFQYYYQSKDPEKSFSKIRNMGKKATAEAINAICEESKKFPETDFNEYFNSVAYVRYTKPMILETIKNENTVYGTNHKNP